MYCELHLHRHSIVQVLFGKAPGSRLPRTAVQRGERQHQKLRLEISQARKAGYPRMRELSHGHSFRSPVRMIPLQLDIAFLLFRCWSFNIFPIDCLLNEAIHHFSLTPLASRPKVSQVSYRAQFWILIVYIEVYECGKSS